MLIKVGSVDFLDGFDEGLGQPATSHCIIEIGENATKGFDLFFANVSNRHWAMKHLGHDQNGFRDQYVIVDRLEDVQVKRAIHSQFGERDYSRFEDFVDAARPFLRWEFEHYQS